MAASLLVVYGEPAPARAGDQQVAVTVFDTHGAMTQDQVSVAELLASCTELPAGSNAPDQYLSNGTLEPGQTLGGASPGTGAWTLANVLGCLPHPIASAAIRSIIVLGADGSPKSSTASQLMAADLTAPSDFTPAAQVPVISTDGTNLTYFRPWRGGIDGNAGDQVTAPSLGFEVFQGATLGVTVTASSQPVIAGRSVRFHARVTGANGSPLSYVWQFNGAGSTSTVPDPGLTFAGAGTYDVSVEVTDAAGGVGVGSLQVTVGSPPPGTTGGKPRNGNGKKKHGSSPTGPTKSHGKSGTGPVGSNAPTSPSIQTTTQPTPTTSAPASTTPAPATTTPTTPTTPATTRHRSSRPHRQARHVPRPAKAAGQIVSGRLIADVVPLPADASPLVREVAQASATPAAREAIGTSPLPAIAASGVIVLLFSLGAWRELRGRGKPRLHNR